MSSSGLLEPTEVRSASHVSRPASSPIWVHALLLGTTLLTTTALGMRYMYNFQQGRPPLSTDEDIFPYTWIFHNLHMLPAGLPFSLTLLAILLAHEFGHYFACKITGVRASLPYLLPAPTLSGTAGAVIKLRSRIRSRQALMLIGASGPIAGFVVAMVTTWIGLALSKPEGAEPVASTIQFAAPLLIELFHALLRHGNAAAPTIYHIVPHPMVVASWVGLLVTAINLIPAGQLDGGHIIYAISPKWHKIVSNVTIGVLVFFGTVYWIGWMLWAVLLMLPAMKHPEVPMDEDLEPWQIALVPICAAIFVFCFSIQPFTQASLVTEFAKMHWGF